MGFRLLFLDRTTQTSSCAKTRPPPETSLPFTALPPHRRWEPLVYRCTRVHWLFCSGQKKIIIILLHLLYIIILRPRCKTPRRRAGGRQIGFWSYNDDDDVSIILCAEREWFMVVRYRGGEKKKTKNKTIVSATAAVHSVIAGRGVKSDRCAVVYVQVDNTRTRNPELDSLPLSRRWRYRGSSGGRYRFPVVLPQHAVHHLLCLITDYNIIIIITGGGGGGGTIFEPQGLNTHTKQFNIKKNYFRYTIFI